jgi:glycosyltransferase involved in cell wall biosynthesis
MSEELISVVLAVWEPTIWQLKRCLKSLIYQTYQNIEIIIIYKKSSQYDKEFFDLIKQINEPRIIVIIDSGTFANQLNEGIKKSKGNIIARMDADDVCKIDRFEKQMAFKKKNDYDVVGSWAHYITNDGEISRDLQLPITHNEIRKKIIFFNPILHSAVLMNKTMLDKIGLYGDNTEYVEDYELWIRAIHKGYKFGNVPECLVSIRHNPNSLTRGNSWKFAKKRAIQVKNYAIKEYRFNNFSDIFYYIMSLSTYFISPNMASKINKAIKRDKY